jgi:hypothetical protein
VSDPNCAQCQAGVTHTHAGLRRTPDPARYLDLDSPDAERRLAAALPDVMSQETADELYGVGTNRLDIHNEWFMPPRELAEAILAALRKP